MGKISSTSDLRMGNEQWAMSNGQWAMSNGQ